MSSGGGAGEGGWADSALAGPLVLAPLGRIFIILGAVRSEANKHTPTPNSGGEEKQITHGDQLMMGATPAKRTTKQEWCDGVDEERGEEEARGKYVDQGK